jgi:hypothetical protein
MPYVAQEISKQRRSITTAGELLEQAERVAGSRNDDTIKSKHQNVVLVGLDGLARMEDVLRNMQCSQARVCAATCHTKTRPL